MQDDGDPKENRTPAFAVKGRRLSRLTMGPHAQLIYVLMELPTTHFLQRSLTTLMGKLTGRLVFPSSRNLLSVIVEHPTNVWARSFSSPSFIFKKSFAASHIPAQASRTSNRKW